MEGGFEGRGAAVGDGRQDCRWREDLKRYAAELGTCRAMI